MQVNQYEYYRYQVSNNHGKPKVIKQRYTASLSEIAFAQALYKQNDGLKKLFADIHQQNYPAEGLLNLITSIHNILIKMDSNRLFLTNNVLVSRDILVHVVYVFKRLPEEFLATYDFLLPDDLFRWDHFDTLTNILRLVDESERITGQELLVLACYPKVIGEFLPQVKQLFATIIQIEQCRLGKQLLPANDFYQRAAQAINNLEINHEDRKAKLELKTVSKDPQSPIRPIKLDHTYFLIKTISDYRGLRRISDSIDALQRLPDLPLTEPLIYSRAEDTNLQISENAFLLQLTSQQVKSAFFSYLSEMGEACKNPKLSAETKKMLLAIPWQALTDLRDHLEHPNEKGKAEIIAAISAAEFKQIKQELRSIQMKVADYLVANYSDLKSAYYQKFLAYQSGPPHPVVSASLNLSLQEKEAYKKIIKAQKGKLITAADLSNYLQFINTDKLTLPSFGRWLTLVSFVNQREPDFVSVVEKITAKFQQKLQVKVTNKKELIFFLNILKGLPPNSQQRFAACLDDKFNIVTVPDRNEMRQLLHTNNERTLIRFAKIFSQLISSPIEKLHEKLHRSVAPRLDRKLRYIAIAHSAIDTAHDYYKFTAYTLSLQNGALSRIWSQIMQGELKQKSEAIAIQTNRPYQEVYQELNKDYEAHFNRFDFSILSSAAEQAMSNAAQNSFNRDTEKNFDKYMNHPRLKAAFRYQITIGLAMLKEIKKFPEIDLIGGFRDFLNRYYSLIKRARNELAHGNELLEDIRKSVDKRPNNNVIKALINPSSELLSYLKDLQAIIEHGYGDIIKVWQDYDESYHNHYSPTLT
ncbi:MAG: hypothetical protein K0S11_433 [Gammaproteobacteria bacterium]|jgi:uncharacterized protein with HEPN domain|nr:hypothetical protein [Gammaproteobacteria bacterium]